METIGDVQEEVRLRYRAAVVADIHGRGCGCDSGRCSQDSGPCCTSDALNVDRLAVAGFIDESVRFTDQVESPMHAVAFRAAKTATSSPDSATASCFGTTGTTDGLPTGGCR